MASCAGVNKCFAEIQLQAGGPKYWLYRLASFRLQRIMPPCSSTCASVPMPWHVLGWVASCQTACMRTHGWADGNAAWYCAELVLCCAAVRVHAVLPRVCPAAVHP